MFTSKQILVSAVCGLVASLMAFSSVSQAQQRTPRQGERRIVEGRCMEYRNGGWTRVDSNFLRGRSFTVVCANASNLREYLRTRPVETLDSRDNIVAAINEGRGWMNNQDRTHACGPDGLVYDVFGTGVATPHHQTLEYSNRRCRIGTQTQYFRTAVGPMRIPSIGGL